METTAQQSSNSGNGWSMPSWQRLLVGWVLVSASLVLCGAVLMRMPGQAVDRLYLPRWAAIAPYGRFEVVCVHLVAGLVIALTLARSVRGWMGEANRNAVVFAALTGGVVAVLTLYFGPVSSRFGFAASYAFAAFWLRVAWTLVLQLPWCLAAMLIWPKTVNGIQGWRLGVVLAAAVLLPMAHGQHAAKRESEQVAYYVSRSQYMKAWSHVVALESMAGVQAGIGAGGPVGFFSTRTEGGRSSELVRSDLVARIIGQFAEASQPLPQDASVREVINRASTLFSLDRLDEAIGILEGAGHRRPDVLLVLAAAYEGQRNHRKAVEILEEAKDSIGDAKGSDVEATTREIYQRLAQNLRLVQRYGDAETVLLEAIERYEHSHGFLYYLLGVHCKNGGRFQKSLEYFQKCTDANADYSARVEAELRQLKRDTPACILRTVKTVTR